MVSGYAANGVSDLIRIDQDVNVGFASGNTCPDDPGPYGTYFAVINHWSSAGQESVRADEVQAVVNAS